MDLTWFQEEGRNLKLSHWGGLEKAKLLIVLREMLTGQGLWGILEGCSRARVKGPGLEEIAALLSTCRSGALFTEV